MAFYFWLNLDGLLRMYYFAAFLLIVIGVVHSVLGEKYLLVRLFRRDNLPKLYGSDSFTKNTLRFAWHITTIAWFGFAALLIYLALLSHSSPILGNIIALTFLVHFLVAVIGSKGKHFSWVFFLVITLCVAYGTYF